jgi:cytochrome P450
VFSWVPIPSNLAFNNAIGKLSSQVNGIITSRLGIEKNQGDLLDMLMEDNRKGGVSTKLIKDNVQTMLFAGTCCF